MAPRLHCSMSEIPQTRRSLLLELSRRSDDAWAEFLLVYEGAIYRVCRSKGLQDADARDVTQEVLAAVQARVSTWDHDGAKGSFRAWLLRVARNISIDSIANRARREAAGGDTETEQLLRELPDTRGDSQAEFDLEYRRSLFAWAADRVRSEVRDVTWRAFQLTAIQGLTAEEAADRLGVPIGSVYTAKCRVVARIRSRVDELRRES
jgi:RNA polymerase sigma factor (sigma-70 family)